MKFSEVVEIISFVSGLMTILGVSGLVSWSFFEKSKPESVADRTVSVFVFSVKFVICLIALPVVAIIPLLVQGQAVLWTSGQGAVMFSNMFWGHFHPMSHIFGWVCFLALFIPFYSLVCASIFASSLKPFSLFWSKFTNQS